MGVGWYLCSCFWMLVGHFGLLGGRGVPDDVCLLFWSAGVVGFNRGLVLMLIRAF